MAKYSWFSQKLVCWGLALVSVIFDLQGSNFHLCRRSLSSSRQKKSDCSRKIRSWRCQGCGWHHGISGRWGVQLIPRLVGKWIELCRVNMLISNLRYLWILYDMGGCGCHHEQQICHCPPTHSQRAWYVFPCGNLSQSTGRQMPTRGRNGYWMRIRSYQGSKGSGW